MAAIRTDRPDGLDQGADLLSLELPSSHLAIQNLEADARWMGSSSCGGRTRP